MYHSRFGSEFEPYGQLCILYICKLPSVEWPSVYKLHILSHSFLNNIYIYIHTHTHTERERDMHIYTNTHTCTLSQPNTHKQTYNMSNYLQASESLSVFLYTHRHILSRTTCKHLSLCLYTQKKTIKLPASI
jgi:hypothetical protein